MKHSAAKEPARPPGHSALDRRLLAWIGLGLAVGFGLTGLASAVGVGRYLRPQARSHQGFRLVSTDPPANGEGSATGSIRLVFSQGVDLASLEQHWGLTPAQQGTFRGDGSQVTFIPQAPWPRGSQVTVELGAGVRDNRDSQSLAPGTTWSFQIRSPKVAYLTPSQGSHVLKEFSADAVGSPRTLLSVTVDASDFRVSPGGDQIAVVRPNAAGGRDVWILDQSSGHFARRTDCRPDACGDPVWLPDREHLAYTQVAPAGTSTVWVLPLQGGAPRPLLDDPGLQAMDPSWSPDGSKVAFYDLNAGTMRIDDLMTGHDLSFHTLNGLVGSWSPDGARMIASILDISQEPPQSVLYLIQTATGSVEPIAAGDLADFGNPVWSPVGDEIAVSARRPGAGPARGIWILRLDGAAAVPVADEPNLAFGGPAWDPWGGSLLFQGASLESLDSAPDVYLWRPGGEPAIPVAQDAFAPAWVP